MKRLFLFLLLAVPFFTMAQEQSKKTKITLSGFVRNDMVFNTRHTVSARGKSCVQLLPLPEVLDAEEKDINEMPNFNISAFGSRLRLGITTADAFGAKTSGVIEADFMGSAKASIFNFRIRQAFMKLDWEKTSLLVGKAWHPLHPTDCSASPLSFGAGAVFNPLSRSPQVRLTHRLGDFSVMAAFVSQGIFKLQSNKTLDNNIIPQGHFQVRYKHQSITTGLGVHFQSRRPQLVSATNYIDDTRVNSFSYFGYAKLSLKPLVAKAYAIYGQNYDNMVMMGGYSVKKMNYTAEQIRKGIFEYASHNVFTTWLDLETTGKKAKFGLLAGYSKNNGADSEIDINTFVGRWEDIDQMFKIAPRVKYIANKVILGFEVEYMNVAYAKQEVDDVTGLPVAGSDVNGIDKKGKVTNSESVDNVKVLLSLTYKF